jgi:hypothetical protein
MRLSTVAIATIGTLFALSASAQSWFEFVERDELFSVNLPQMPAVEEIIFHSEFGADLPGKLFTTTDGQVQYRITVVDYSVSDLPNHSPLWDFYGSVDYAAWNIRKRGGDITYDAWTQVDRIAGHQLQVTNADQSRSYVQILSHKERLYILEAIAPAGSTPPIHFQQSLRIIDENGNAVRYDRDMRTRLGIEESLSP